MLNEKMVNTLAELENFNYFLITHSSEHIIHIPIQPSRYKHERYDSLLMTYVYGLPSCPICPLYKSVS